MFAAAGADVVGVDLRIGEIQIPRRLSVERHLLHVPDDPDDFDRPRRSVVVVHQQARADRLEPVEPLAGQLLVHHRHRPRPVGVALRERAPALQRDARRFEVPGRHGAELRERHALPFDGSTLHRERHARQQSAQAEAARSRPSA